MGQMLTLGGGHTSARFDTYGYGSARWYNQANGQGTDADRHHETLFLPGEPIPAFTVDSLMRFQGIARRIVSREPADALREGIDFDGMDPQVKRDTLTELDRLGAIAAIKLARTWERAYGGGAIVCFVADGRDPSEPVDLGNIRRVESLLVVDRHELQVGKWETSPRSPQLGKPKTWILNGGNIGEGAELSGTEFHHTRVITFDGLPLPRRDVIANFGWGGSHLDLVWNELRNYGATHAHAAEAVSLLTQGVFKTDVSRAVRAGRSDEIVERMRALRQGMGLMGDIVIDRNEDYSIQNRPLNGIEKALDAFVAALVAATDMPRSILLGESPGGFSSGDNAGETRSWYDHVSAGRGTDYTPRVMHLLTLIWYSKMGPTRGQIPKGWRIEWPELWQLTEKERAEVRKINADARKADVEAAIVSGDEARLDPDIAKQYPEIDPAQPAPELPGGGGGGGFGGDEMDDEDAAALVPAMTSLIPPGEKLLTAKALGAKYNVSPGRIHSMASRDMIHMFKPGRIAGYLESEFLRAIGASPEPARADAKGGPSSPFEVPATE